MNVRGILRRLGDRPGIAEATYARDADLRAQAERFYKDLHAYLDVPEDELRRRLIEGRDGSFSVWARDFTQGADDLIVVFGPQRGGRKAGVGTFRGHDALVIYALLAPGDPRFLATRVLQDVVVHEVIHLLDPGRRAGHGGAHAIARGGEAAYYNEPSEWNAYWQEGAAQLERLLRKMATPGKPEARSKAFDHFFVDGSLRALQDRAGRFWDPDFLDAMDAKTRRKFDKRLAALWVALREQGLLGESVRSVLDRLEEGSAVDPQVETIVTEMMGVLPDGLPRPAIKYVDQLRARWLGTCTYTVGAPTTTIRLQRLIMGDEPTLRRIVAHELCHHAEFLAGWAAAQAKGQDARSFQATERLLGRFTQGGHGSTFKEYADLFNARYGAGFVTVKSDETYVKSETSRDLLLLLAMNGSRLMYAVAQRPGPKQRAYLERIFGRDDADKYRLVRTRDATWTTGASIGNGYSVPNSVERAKALAQLWNDGQVVHLADI